MSDQPLHPSWWQASDGKWYPPEQYPDPAPTQQVPWVAAPSTEAVWDDTAFVPPDAPKRSAWSRVWPWLGVAVAGLFVLGLIGAVFGESDDDVEAADVVADETTTTGASTTSTSTTTSTTTTSTTTTTTQPPRTTAPPPPPPPPTTAPPPPLPPTTTAPPPPPPPVAAPSGGSIYYENCTAARNAGAAPVLRGQPGYGGHLDRDGDGVGCE